MRIWHIFSFGLFHLAQIKYALKFSTIENLYHHLKLIWIKRKNCLRIFEMLRKSNNMNSIYKPQTAITYKFIVCFLNDIINLIKTFESPKLKQVFGQKSRQTVNRETGNWEQRTESRESVIFLFLFYTYKASMNNGVSFIYKEHSDDLEHEDCQQQQAESWVKVEINYK